VGPEEVAVQSIYFLDRITSTSYDKRNVEKLLLARNSIFYGFDSDVPVSVASLVWLKRGNNTAPPQALLIPFWDILMLHKCSSASDYRRSQRPCEDSISRDSAFGAPPLSYPQVPVNTDGPSSLSTDPAEWGFT